MFVLLRVYTENELTIQAAANALQPCNNQHKLAFLYRKKPSAKGCTGTLQPAGLLWLSTSIKNC